MDLDFHVAAQHRGSSWVDFLGRGGFSWVDLDSHVITPIVDPPGWIFLAGADFLHPFFPSYPIVSTLALFCSEIWYGKGKMNSA